jgi:Ca-activated chloride channel family protein
VFARSEAGGGDLERIYVSGIRQQVAQREYQATREKLWFERFQWFVGLAILLLVAEFCLHDVRLTALLLVGLGLSASAPPALAGSLAEVYNQSVERYRKGDFAAAARGFAAAGDSTDQVLAETSLFNLGNTQVQLGKLDEAIKAYENALALDPKDQQARENLEYVKKLKDQQDKQKDQSKTDHNQNNPDQQQQQNNPPPPQGQQDQNQSNKQDQQNQNQNQQDQQKNQQDQNQSNKQDQQNQQPQGGQPEQKPQDQNKDQSKEQKGAGEQDPSKKDPSKDKPDQQPSGGGQGQDKDKNKDEKDKSQDKQPGKDGDKQPQDEGPGGAGQGGNDQQDNQDKQDKQDQQQSNRGAQGELQPQQMSPEEAEKVLRAVDDNPKKFLYAPKDKNPPRHKDKDW